MTPTEGTTGNSSNFDLLKPKDKCVGYRIPPSALNGYCAYLVYQLLVQLLTQLGAVK